MNCLVYDSQKLQYVFHIEFPFDFIKVFCKYFKNKKKYSNYSSDSNTQCMKINLFNPSPELNTCFNRFYLLMLSEQKEII